MAYVELDGDRKPCFAPAQVCDLSHEVFEELSKCLNPRLLGKDYRSLAGKMGLSHRAVKNLDRTQNPTEELLNIWMTGSDSTVSDLIDLFIKIQRHDAIKLVKDHEFKITKNRPVSGTSISKEPIEHDVNYDTDEETNNSICSFDGLDSRSSSCSFRSRTNTGDNLMSERMHQPPPEVCGMSSTLSFIDSKSNSFSRSRTNTGDYYERHLISTQREPCAPFSHSIFNDTDNEILLRKLNNASENDDKCHPYYTYTHREGIPINGPVCTSEKNPKTEQKLLEEYEIDDSMQTERHSPLHLNGTQTNFTPSFPTLSVGQSTQVSNPIIATDKIALLIGNQFYKNLEPLLFPHRDVEGLGRALKEMEFTVLSLVDLTLKEMRTIMLAYCQLLGPGVFAVFYYAGHGFEENGENYLMPVDATTDKKEEEFIKAQEFLTEMQLAQTALNLVIIDTCRVKGINVKNSRNGSLRRGDFGNTIIAYSCQSQMPAFEECNQTNGVYMNELLPRIKQNKRIEHILMEVNSAVHGNSSVIQRPVFESDSIGDCRLTTIINSEALAQHWSQRFNSLVHATTVPECQDFRREEEGLVVRLHYGTKFCNELIIAVFIENNNDQRMEIIEISLKNGSDLVVRERSSLERYVDPGNRIKICEFELEGLQKVTSPLFLVLQMQVRIKIQTENIELKLNANFPLISSLMHEFRNWIISDKRVATGALKNTWV